MEKKLKIAVAAANFAHTFPSTVYSRIEKLAEGCCELLRLSTTGVSENEKEKLINTLARAEIHALIGISISPDKSVIASYTTAKAPVVLIDEEVLGASTVASDNFAGGYLAGKRFAETFKKKPAVITGRLNTEGSYNAKRRFEGFLKAITAAGLSLENRHIKEIVSYSYNEGSDAMLELISGNAMPDSVFCAAGDMAALGAIKTMREKSVKCPEEIVIIGFDDITAASTSRPKMTTVKQPIEEMAKTAFMLCLERREEILAAPQKLIFKPELIVRESA